MAASILKNQRRVSRRAPSRPGLIRRVTGSFPLPNIPGRRLLAGLGAWTRRAGQAAGAASRSVLGRIRRSLPGLPRPSSRGLSGRIQSLGRSFAGRPGFPIRAGRFPSLPGGEWSLYALVSSVQPRTRRAFITCLAATLGVICCWLFIFAPKGLLARHELREVMEEKRTEIEDLKRGNQDLQRQIAMLAGDTDTIESIARNELNLALPGETIYRTLEEDGPPRYVLNPGAPAPAIP